MKKFYYVVYVGRTPGVFDSWAACNQQVSGYPHALFKKFETLDEANTAFLTDYTTTRPIGRTEALLDTQVPLLPTVEQTLTNTDHATHEHVVGRSRCGHNCAWFILGAAMSLLVQYVVWYFFF